MVITNTEVVPPQQSTVFREVQSEGEEQGERKARKGKSNKANNRSSSSSSAAAAGPPEGQSPTTAIQHALAALAVASEKSSSLSEGSFPTPSKHQRKVREPLPLPCCMAVHVVLTFFFVELAVQLYPGS